MSRRCCHSNGSIAWRIASVSRRLLFGAIVVALGGLLATPSRADTTATYLHIAGVPGESTAPGHVGWIEVSSASHYVAKPQGLPSQHGAYHFAKRIDSASPKLSLAACTGTNIPNAQLDIVNVTNHGAVFYSIALSNVFVESVSAVVEQGGGTGESLSLAYEQISWTYLQLLTNGAILVTNVANWAVVSNTGSYASHPTATDSDGDGMPDYYEVNNGLNPFVNDANGDLDGDGLSNYQEYLAGTQANNPNSVFRVSRINLASGQVRVTWTSEAGRSYTVHAASDVRGPYTAVRTVPSAGAGETFTDFAPAPALQFFRISTP